MSQVGAKGTSGGAGGSGKGNASETRLLRETNALLAPPLALVLVHKVDDDPVEAGTKAGIELLPRRPLPCDHKGN